MTASGEIIDDEEETDSSRVMLPLYQAHGIPWIIGTFRAEPQAYSLQTTELMVACDFVG